MSAKRKLLVIQLSPEQAEQVEAIRRQSGLSGSAIGKVALARMFRDWLPLRGQAHDRHEAAA